VVASEAEAFRQVLEPGFDPARTAVVERDPGLAEVPGAVPGDAVYSETDPEHVRVTVDATAPSLVVIRNSYDEGWSATVDGAPAEVLPADGFLQGVAVDAGHHEVALTYRDPAIGRGLAVSAVVWLALGAALAGCAFVERRRRRGRALRSVVGRRLGEPGSGGD
jgi:hypothetical protein